MQADFTSPNINGGIISSEPTIFDYEKFKKMHKQYELEQQMKAASKEKINHTFEKAKEEVQQNTGKVSNAKKRAINCGVFQLVSTAVDLAIIAKTKGIKYIKDRINIIGKGNCVAIAAGLVGTSALIGVGIGKLVDAIRAKKAQKAE